MKGKGKGGKLRGDRVSEVEESEESRKPREGVGNS